MSAASDDKLIKAGGKAGNVGLEASLIQKQEEEEGKEFLARCGRGASCLLVICYSGV